MNNRFSPLPIFALLTVLLLPNSPGLHAQPPVVPDTPGSDNASPGPHAATATPNTPVPLSPEPTMPDSGASANAAGPTFYTVTRGDTLSFLSHRFHVSVRSLKKVNHLKSTHLKPGQVLTIPASKSTAKKITKTSSKKKKKKKTSLVYFHHPPTVVDYDLPPSDFASCPVPVPAESTEPDSESPDPYAAPRMATTMPPSGRITSDTPSGPVYLPRITPLPVKISPPEATEPRPAIATMPPYAPPATNIFSRSPSYSTSQLPTYSGPMASTARPVNHGFFNFFYSPPPTDWGERFTLAARDLGNQGISYDEDWRPPGESHSWSMDCSNTTRYLYRVTAGITLPRTASDQYYYLHLQNKAWDVPQLADGFADCNYLRQNLKAGDLLFWENTYRPERQPPITHVMIFLGTNDRGEWIMAGSQSTRGGEHNRRHGGPDVYVFNPTRPCGGYTSWFGFVHHQGRFCAFGRPLDADKAKLAMAAND